DLRFPGPASAAPEGNLSAPYPPFRRVAATPYPAYGVYRRSSLPRPGKRCAAGQSIGAYPPFRRVAAAPYPAY
ncbi:hypothetical protein, partial [Klebsiella pneumoniae]|uniref:hypothetical protein n=1 Tax=Klebsiella pneumoniae TaxID=573 RepID=UPI001CA4488D